MIDLKGAYLAPSLIDGHFHIESSMLAAPEFARAVVPHGTGAVVIDPHEYANVLGLDGIRYALESTKNLAVDFFIMLPSCVPATHLETAGARLTADDLKLMISDERVAGVLARTDEFSRRVSSVIIKRTRQNRKPARANALTATHPACVEKISMPTRWPGCVQIMNPWTSKKRAKNCGSACTSCCAKGARNEIWNI